MTFSTSIILSLFSTCSTYNIVIYMKPAQKHCSIKIIGIVLSLLLLLLLLLLLFLLFLLLLFSSEKVVQLPKTLQDFHELGSRPEGHVCEVKVPPRYNTVRGYIAIPSTSELLYFEELLSGIPKKKVGNIQLKTIVQFSVAKNRHGFFAKDLFIKVRFKLFKPSKKGMICPQLKGAN